LQEQNPSTKKNSQQLWVDGLAELVDARGGLARTCVSNTEELTKGSGLEQGA